MTRILTGHTTFGTCMNIVQEPLGAVRPGKWNREVPRMASAPKGGRNRTNLSPNTLKLSNISNDPKSVCRSRMIIVHITNGLLQPSILKPSMETPRNAPPLDLGPQGFPRDQTPQGGSVGDHLVL